VKFFLRIRSIGDLRPFRRDFCPIIGIFEKMKWLLSLLIPALFIGCAVSKNPERSTFRGLQKGKIKDDTSYVYSLPFAPGKRYRVIQGYFSSMTHKERAAIDFNMKKGSKVHAARGGIVVRVKEDGTRGGMNSKYRLDGNMIIIQHNDSTRAGYWHLSPNGAFVNVGDTVQQGQLIGLSGNTGYTSMPHLHFLVWKRTTDGQWHQIGTRFRTNKGITYLRPYQRYRNPEKK
jgi:murein DD-endopeptidase MepM/ murein hydrolase activator NlpD